MKNWPITGLPVPYDELLEPVVWTIMGKRKYDGFPFPIVPGAESYKTPEDVVNLIGNTELALLMSGFLLGVEQGKRLAMWKLDGWFEAIVEFEEAVLYDENGNRRTSVDAPTVSEIASKMIRSSDGKFKDRLIRLIETRGYGDRDWVSIESLKEMIKIL